MITLPIYLELPFKYKKIQKKNKNKLYDTPLNFNEVRLMNRFTYPKVKTAFHESIKDKISGLTFKCPLKVEFNLYYKNKQSDLPNWESVVNKFFLDSLQKEGCIVDDNVIHITETVGKVKGQDKDNPRIEAVIIENYKG